ncbi:hypothetical protein JR316_0001391 [Psilocybe cubensis]|uniref:Uncharacterized protein n=3 Tax=Psilocybe cubensis TaxID=181762 RepID=A0ACB8HHK8_PSICU|nr:hypothetical protein JR316_0001391 [Psilocybe cubensis]KAH9487318.1 hypothetical protein JR316_0001391 [Psilocybe cubensis]
MAETTVPRQVEMPRKRKEKSANVPQGGRYHALSRRIRDRELKHGHDLDSLVPILASSSLNLRQASESAIVCLVDWFQECNSHRWMAFISKSSPESIAKRHEKLVKELENLQNALTEFRTVERVQLIKPYERFFDPKTRLLLTNCDMFTSRSLYICFVFIDTIDAFSEAIVKMLKIVTEIDAQRPKPKVWFPGRIVKASQNITNSDFKDVDGPIALGTSQNPVVFSSNESSQTSLTESESDDEDEESEEKKRKELDDQACPAEPPKKQDPDAFPPTTAFGRMVVKVAPFFRFFKSPQGIFALRMGIVSVALWIPSVCHSSAWFYYDNKGLWALIMGQMGLAVYAGDQIAGFIVRITGTLLGLVGQFFAVKSDITSTNTDATLQLDWLSGTLGQAMGTETLTDSWVNANIDVISNPGVGVTLGWKRALLVIIGFTAGFIVMLFPNPISSRVLVRKTLAAVISESGNIFAGEVEAFLSEEQKGRSGIYEKIELVGRAEPDDKKVSPKERRIRRIARRVIAVSAADDRPVAFDG